MSFLPAVVRAEYRGDYRIQVTFSDDSQNTIDFREWLEGPIFEPLRNLQFFQRFFVDGGTVVWPNGADIAPETLYEVPGRKRRPRGRATRTNTRRAVAAKVPARLRARG